MPKYIYRRQTPVSYDTLNRRRRTSSVRGYKAWRDPHPEIVGTKPEKIVYAVLEQIGIPFKYQTYLRATLPEFNFDKFYRLDFQLHTLKIAIEVQGFYWHSQEDQIEKDAFKFAVLEQLGWKVLDWWDYEIEDNVWDLVLKEPRLAHYRGARVGEVVTKDKRVIDDSAGIRKANTGRTDYSLNIPRYNYGRSTKGRYSYNAR